MLGKGVGQTQTEVTSKKIQDTGNTMQQYTHISYLHTLLPAFCQLVPEQIPSTAGNSSYPPQPVHTDLERSSPSDTTTITHTLN